MGETQSDIQGQRPRISKMAIASLLLGVMGFFILPFATVTHYPCDLRVSFRNIVGLLGISGLILGIVALLQITISRGTLKGSKFAVVGLVLTVLSSGFWLNETYRPRSIAVWSPGTVNLQRLGRAMLIYAYEDNNDQYPEPNEWCDVLLKHGQVGIENFTCPSIGLRWPYKYGNWPFGLGNWPAKGSSLPFGARTVLTLPGPKSRRCHFAMNPKCKPDSPPDTVLLFESKEGWNQFGGPEILTSEGQNRQGCFILYNDMRTSFIKRRSIANLNWADGQKQ